MLKVKTKLIKKPKKQKSFGVNWAMTSEPAVMQSMGYLPLIDGSYTLNINTPGAKLLRNNLKWLSLASQAPAGGLYTFNPANVTAEALGAMYGPMVNFLGYAGTMDDKRNKLMQKNKRSSFYMNAVAPFIDPFGMLIDEK